LLPCFPLPTIQQLYRFLIACNLLETALKIGSCFVCGKKGIK
jgi:hypothetical protein